RNDVSAIVKLSHRIAAGFHQLIHQAVGSLDGSPGIIDKLRLHGVPSISEFLAACRRERMNGQSLALFLAKLEHALALLHVALFPYHAVILGPESFTQFLASAIPKEEPRHDSDEERDRNRDENDLGTLVHGCRPF